MNCKSNPFQDLPFSRLFQDYTSADQKILNYFAANPFSETDIKRKADNFRFRGDRSETLSVLQEFNALFDAPDATIRSIEKLGRDDSLAIVTGQQVTLYGGPLFTIYKTLTVLIYARRWEKLLGRPVIPVFWLADEDHDFDEIARIGIPVSDEPERFLFDTEGNTKIPSADIDLGEGFTAFRDRVLNELTETDFTGDLRNTLDSYYKNGESAGRAFGKLLLHLFGNRGLVLAGSHFPPVKRKAKDIFIKSVKKHTGLYDVLTETSRKLENDGYHSQVLVQPSNLFWYNEKGERVKISKDDNRDKWLPDSGGEGWTEEELTRDIDAHPESFSPNVFLRPLVQDLVLPTIAYAGGPGEIAYYAQMKHFYHGLDMEMPVILPRFSATIVETGVNRIMEKLPFSFSDYHQRIEDLESRFIDSTDTPDLEQFFEEWKSRISNITDEHKTKIGEFDATLESSAGKAEAVFFSELDKLKGKLYRSAKQQKKTQLLRLRKIRNNLFPDRNLQERETAFIYYMNKYGPDVWNEISGCFEEDQPDSHKFICL